MYDDSESESGRLTGGLFGLGALSVFFIIGLIILTVLLCGIIVVLGFLLVALKAKMALASRGAAAKGAGAGAKAGLLKKQGSTVTPMTPSGRDPSEYPEGKPVKQNYVSIGGRPTSDRVVEPDTGSRDKGIDQAKTKTGDDLIEEVDEENHPLHDNSQDVIVDGSDGEQMKYQMY